jgi:hypothetical protein
MWSRNKANLYIQDALNEFEPDLKYPHASPPAQYRIYRNKLKVTHLVGFGSGVSGAAASSLSFASGDYMTFAGHADFSIASGALWCLDLWAYWTGTPANYYLYDFSNQGAGWTESDRIYFRDDAGNMQVGWNNANFLDGGSNPAGDTWTHIALTHNADDLIVLYVDGTSVVSGTDNNAIDLTDATPSYQLNWGRGVGSSWYHNGYLDEMRISNGAIRWTNNFIPSSVPYVSDSYTKMLIHCNEVVVGGNFTDSGNTGHTMTLHGSCSQNTAIAKM